MHSITNDSIGKNENTVHTDTHNRNKMRKIYTKELGQYFTISTVLQECVFNMVKHKSSRLLEPSFGAGHLLKPFKDYDDNYPMVCYELDETIPLVVSFNTYQKVIYGDFTLQPLTEKFKTIIGNPPYIKQRKGNLYIKFIELCYNYLADDGELIFIVPSNFMKQTSASSIIETMTQHGCFTDFLFPHDEKLFEGASIDVVVFRYEKGIRSKKTCVNGIEMFCNVNNGILTFSETERLGNPVEVEFNVYVGLVSGKDAIFRVPFGNINILNDKNKVESYIFTDSFPTENEEVNRHLLSHKTELLSRKIKAFNDTNWFKWGAPRNLSNIYKYWGQRCIYVKTMTRHKEVAFEGVVQYFGGSLLCLIPKKTMTDAELKNKIEYLNSSTFQKDYLYAGRFKIGHKQICNTIIPM